MKTTDVEVSPEMLQAAFNASFEECDWLGDDREACIKVIVKAAFAAWAPAMQPVVKGCGELLEGGGGG